MRVHISLNVKDINESVGFYKKMLGMDPVKLFNAERNNDSGEGLSESKRGYAKFDSEETGLNLVLNEAEFNAGGSLSHLGLQVKSTDEVLKFRDKWVEEGLLTVDEMEVDCCYAKQDKTWVRDPDGNEWEAFVVLEDLDSMETSGSCDCANVVADHDEVSGDFSKDSCCDANPVEVVGRVPNHATCCQTN